MPVTIPGLKVLDEILAGLPTNSAQRLEINKLKEQIAALEKENENLKRTIVELTPKQDSVVRIGGAYFKKDVDGKATGYAYCVHCYESNGQLKSLSHMLADRFVCPNCKAHAQSHFGWPAEAKD